MNWKLKFGNFLFKNRSFTPLPFIVLVLAVFEPVNLGDKNVLMNLVGLGISMLGEVIRIMAVGFSFPGTSGRETYLRADHLNSTGIYSLVRNPLYIGNFFMFAGIVTVFANVYALGVFTFFLIGQYFFIIMAEENYLSGKYGKEYQDYLGNVRRVFPRFFGYIPNENPFSGKKVLFKEKSSVFNMFVMYILVLVYKDKVFYGTIENVWVYIISVVVLVLIYIALKIARKKHENK